MTDYGSWVGHGVKVTLTPWLAGRKNIGIVHYGYVVAETAKAICLETNRGRKLWLPKSRIAIVESPVPEVSL